MCKPNKVADDLGISDLLLLTIDPEAPVAYLGINPLISEARESSVKNGGQRPGRLLRLSAAGVLGDAAVRDDAVGARGVSMSSFPSLFGLFAFRR